MKNKGGRPSKYCKEITNEICLRLAHGESLRQICRSEHIPDIGTILDWLIDDRKVEFHQQYARAREIQAEYMFDEIIDIADDGSNDWMEIETKSGRVIEVGNHEHMNRSRLRVDTRKWYLSKVLPKKFGEKTQVEHSGTIDLNAKNILQAVEEAETQAVSRLTKVSTN